MPGERDLETLLSSMNPVLHPDTFVFATMSESARKKLNLQPILEFREAEGVTIIVKQNEAASIGLKAQYLCRMITLNVHSSLEAVGFLARISTALAEKGISANVVSAFYHDHLFVPVERAEEALGVLKRLVGARNEKCP